MTATQLDIGFLPAGSAVGNDCSESAAATLRESGRLATLRRQVLQLFAAAGDAGRTADEIVSMFSHGWDSNTYASRVTELHGMGYLDRVVVGRTTKSFLKRKTRSGGSAYVLVITTAGKRALG